MSAFRGSFFDQCLREALAPSRKSAHHSPIGWRGCRFGWSDPEYSHQNVFDVLAAPCLFQNQRFQFGFMNLDGHDRSPLVPLSPTEEPGKMHSGFLALFLGLLMGLCTESDRHQVRVNLEVT
jgi:hypothetical protein